MDKKRLMELAGVTAPTEYEKLLEETTAAAKDETLDETLEEGMFGAAGYGGDKSPEQDVMSRLAHMLRDAKVFLRDGNIEDAAMMVDRAYAAVSKSARG